MEGAGKGKQWIKSTTSFYIRSCLSCSPGVKYHQEVWLNLIGNWECHPGAMIVNVSFKDADQCQFQRCRFGNYAQVWNRGPEWDHEKIQSKQDKTEPCRTLIAEEPEEEEVEFKREKKKSSTPSWHSPSKTEQWWPTHKGTQADRWARGNKPAKTVVFLDNKDRKHG